MKQIVIIVAMVVVCTFSQETFALEQLVLMNTFKGYTMKENNNKEGHHHFQFYQRPPGNDFSNYRPKTHATWHIRVQLLERPSRKIFGIGIFLDDHKWYGHRQLKVFKVTDSLPPVFKAEIKGYPTKPNATPIDWGNPKGADLFVASRRMAPLLDTCGEIQGHGLNLMYCEKDFFPYKIWATVTLVPAGMEYDDCGHPGGSCGAVVESGKGRRNLIGERLRVSRHGGQHFFKTSGQQADGKSLEIYDAYGKLLANARWKNAGSDMYHASWKSRQAPMGVYFARVGHSSTCQVKKFVVVHDD